MPSGYRKNGTKLGFQKGHCLSKGKKNGMSGRSQEKHPNFKKHWKIKDTSNMSKAIQGRHNRGEKFGFQKGQESYNKGIKGKDSHAWIDGSSKINSPYPEDWTDTLREAIRQRDDYVCQECGTHQDELKQKLDVHHIDYIKENCNPDNLISLCKRCHMKTNFNRDYWFNYFNALQ